MLAFNLVCVAVSWMASVYAAYLFGQISGIDFARKIREGR